jgi:hypothetical protein
VSLGALKVMSAIESCRTAALGGHVARCENAACGHTVIAYNSCRNRHCPKCQGAAAREWMEARSAELLPVPYFHVVFTLPAANLARMRELLDVAPPVEPHPEPSTAETADALPTPCPCCGSAMHILERFKAGCVPHHRASMSAIAIRIDTS